MSLSEFHFLTTHRAVMVTSGNCVAVAKGGRRKDRAWQSAEAPIHTPPTVARTVQRRCANKCLGTGVGSYSRGAWPCWREMRTPCLPFSTSLWQPRTKPDRDAGRGGFTQRKPSHTCILDASTLLWQVLTPVSNVSINWGVDEG